MTRLIRLGGFYRSLPMLVGEEQGFYENRDVRVEFDQVTSSIQQFQSLADGDYDVVQTSPDNSANYRLNKNNPIGQIVDAPGFVALDYGMYLVVVAQPEIETVEQLRGSIISVDAPESGFAYVIYKILANHGLERGVDYDIVATGGVYARYTAMVVDNAEFAATLMSGGFETRAASQGYRLLESVQDIYDLYLGVWAAGGRRWLDENEELAVDFVSAYREASAWVFDPVNEEACVDLLERIPNTSRDLARQLYQVQVRPGVGNVPDGVIDPEAVRSVLSLRSDFAGFEEEQEIDALVAPGTGLFDLTYLESSRTRVPLG
jgi:ABC-type nitrate/sulfonate/bicarbonate transport system substrate-binding protein